MLQSKGRYSLDCINDVTCGSVWGTITTLENIDEAVQQRGAFRAKIEFYGILEEYNGNRYAFFKDLGRETEESLQEQVRTATEQLEESKLEIVRLKAEIYDILSKNGDI